MELRRKLPLFFLSPVPSLRGSEGAAAIRTPSLILLLDLIYRITNGASAFLPVREEKLQKKRTKEGAKHARREYEYPPAAYILPLLAILPLLRDAGIIYMYCLAALSCRSAALLMK